MFEEIFEPCVLYQGSGIARSRQIKEAVDFRVAWNGGSSAVCGITPPRVVAALAHQRAAVSREVANQLAAFHTFSGASSYSCPA